MGVLAQQPGQGDLRIRHAFGMGKTTQGIDHGLVGHLSRTAETRQHVAKVIRCQAGLVQCARQKRAAQRAVGNKGGAQFGAGGQHVGFRLTRPQRILTLYRCNRVDGMGFAQGGA